MSEHTPIHYKVTKRLFDLLVAGVALAMGFPIYIVAFMRQHSLRHNLQQVKFVGRGLGQFTSYTSNSAVIRRAIRFWDVVRGQASIVGPRLIPVHEISGDAMAIRRFVPPGLICLQWLRTRSNVAFTPEYLSDCEYAEKRSLMLDLSIIVRALLVFLYGKPSQSVRGTEQILGVRIDNMTQDEALDYIDNAIENGNSETQVAFVNADCLNKAARNREYKLLLNSTSLVLADGIGIKMAGTLLSRPIKQNVNGTDMFPHLCARLEKKGGRLFLLGARSEVVKQLADRIRIQYPGIVICGAADGYFKDEDAQVKEIAASAPDLLLVALGAPRQELFIARNAHRLGAKVSIGVGGLFDFYSGRIPRAPQWLRDAGLEWTYRLYQEPGRMWKRYLVGNLLFLARALWEKIGLAYNETKPVQVRVA